MFNKIWDHIRYFRESNDAHRERKERKEREYWQAFHRELPRFMEDRQRSRVLAKKMFQELCKTKQFATQSEKPTDAPKEEKKQE